jgi:hypothetical protein
LISAFVFPIKCQLESHVQSQFSRNATYVTQDFLKIHWSMGL